MTRHARKALVLGGAAWNTLVFLDAFPAPEPQTIFARAAWETVGSSGAGKALNLAHLGAEVTFWALVGDDEQGDRIREAMAARGIRFLTEVDPAGTQRHVNLMDARGERISIFVNPGSDDLDIETSHIAAAAQYADLATVTITNHCRRYLALLRDLGRPIWIDIHAYDGEDPHHAEFIQAADYLFMSSTGMTEWRAFLESRIEAGTTAAVCTHGAAGASGLTAADGWIDVPAATVPEVVDSNGAGDALFAGFATAWLDDLGLAASLLRGAEVAAAAVQSPELAPRPP